MLNALAKEKSVHLANQRFRARTERKPRSFLSLLDVTRDETKTLIRRGLEMKRSPGDFSEVLRGMSVALLFQKTSTRTRCSFENAANELGAFSSYIDWRTSNFMLADLRDEIVVLSKYYNLIVSRVIENKTLQIMSGYSESPVVNGMCNRMHPCQALADYMTMSEFFGMDLEGLKLTYIGDGNNVCRSLVHGASRLGVHITLCSPEKYRLDEETVQEAKGFVECVKDPFDAVCNADVIYTDTWISIGDESQTEERLKAFRSYQVNNDLFSRAPKHALFMHCLPAHPDQEVTPDILRGARSIVFDQAENRKHAQKALLQMLATPDVETSYEKYFTKRHTA